MHLWLTRLLRFYILFALLQPFMTYAGISNNHLKKLASITPEDIATESSMANIEGEPSAFVGKHVNVITGDFNDFQVDLVIPGVDPLTVERSFSGTTDGDGSLCAGWNLNLYGWLEQSVYRDDDDERCFRATVGEGHGATSVFERTLKRQKEIADVPLSPAMLKRGVTNTSSGFMSGQTDIRNRRLHKVEGEDSFIIRNGNGGIKQYDISQGFLTKYRLKQEVKPDGNKIKYKYLKNKIHKNNIRPHTYDVLYSVEAVNQEDKGTGSLQYVPIDRDDFRKFPHQDVIACDGRQVRYHFKMTSKHDKRLDCLLTKIERTNAPTESYEYIEGERDLGLIGRKELPEGRFLEINYYQKGDNNVGLDHVKIKSAKDIVVNRVKELRAPVGNDDTPIITHRFVYQFTGPCENDDKKIRAGTTTVYDALDHKTTYAYDKHHRLNMIDRFKDTGEVYSRLYFNWGGSKTEQNTCLVSKALQTAFGDLVFARSYVYDAYGNVLQDTLHGNLSGNNTIAPVLSKRSVVDNGCEQYSKRFTYSQDGFNLLLVEEDDTLKTTYQYCPNSNKLSAKFIWDQDKIVRREFYEYNSYSAVVREIIDDGSSTDPNDLTNVTERHIKYLSPRIFYPVGSPELILEKCLDLATGQELLIHKTVNVFTDQGLLSQQLHYDSKDSHVYTLSWDHDAHGNIIRQSDAMGNVTSRRFDANDNCIYEQGPNTNFHKEFTYDFVNRLTRVEEIHSDGVRRSISYRYNLLSHLIATVDEYGNEISYDYDPYGRVSCITYPMVLNEHLMPCNPKEYKDYNEMGHLTKVVDAAGREKLMWYNIRGQLIRIVYPDGSYESNVYNLDGTLQKSTGKDGTTTCCSYDVLGRQTKIEIFSASGKLLSTSSSVYNTFHLLAEIDPMGITTLYSYYPDGSLKSKQRGDSLSTFEYDSLGRLVRTLEYFGFGPDDYITKVHEYDLLNRVIEERIEDPSGNVQSRTAYTFDVAGNISQVTTGDLNVHTTVYDSRDVAILSIDPEGNKSVTSCRYDFINAFGQNVPYKEITDPMGNITAITSDALGRVVSTIRKNAFKIIQKNEVFYDLRGNICHLHDTVISPDGSERLVITEMSYDSLGHLIERREAVGSPETKVMRYTYNLAGRMTNHVKADGTILNYSYDELCRLTRLQASDGTIDYKYEYNSNHNPTHVVDLIANSSTTKQYDFTGRMIKEVLGNGLVMEYVYDRLGRTTLACLPDGSGIGYIYKGLYLKEIQRLNDQSDVLYKHVYNTFDMSGNVTQESLINNAGSIEHYYDRLGRRTKSTTKCWYEEIQSYDGVGNILKRHLKDKDGEFTFNYTYDSLYQLQSEHNEASENGLSDHSHSYSHTYSPSYSHSYTYDSLYNRIQKDGKTHLHNSLNQILRDGSLSYSYDPNGNLIQKTTCNDNEGSDGGYITESYQYDALDRLIAFENESVRATYSYDENNRRLSKSIYRKDDADRKNNSGDWLLDDSTRYLYQGQNDIGALNDRGDVIELRLLGIGKGAEIGASVSIEIGNEIYAPIHDHAGNIACILNSEDGSVADVYKYSAFGEELFEELFNDSISKDGEPISPWRFSSKRHDGESGLVYFGRRYYSPSIGRWSSQDPLGRDGGANLYAYVLNSPLTHYDLYGLFGVPECVTSLFSNWDTFSNKSSKFMSNMIKLPGRTIETFGFHMIPFPVVKDAVEIVGWTLKGKNPMNYTPGWKRPQSQLYIHEGYGELDPHIRFVMYNGICTKFEQFQKDCSEFSHRYGGVNVYGVYNSTQGLVRDLIEVGFQKLNIRTEAQVCAERDTRTILNTMGNHQDHGILNTSAHSQGCETVYNLSYNLRSKMEVSGYGPARILQKEDFRSANNYLSSWDFVTPLADPIGLFRGMRSNVVNIIETKGCPLKGHYINGQTYERVIQDKGKKVKKTYGWVE